MRTPRPCRRIAERLEREARVSRPGGAVRRGGAARAQPCGLRHVEDVRRPSRSPARRTAPKSTSAVMSWAPGPAARRRRARRRGRCAGAGRPLVAPRAGLAVVEDEQGPARECARQRGLQLGLRGRDVVLGARARLTPAARSGSPRRPAGAPGTKRKRRSAPSRRAARPASAGGAPGRRRAPRWRRSRRARPRARASSAQRAPAPAPAPARACPRRARRARGRAAGRRARLRAPGQRSVARADLGERERLGPAEALPERAQLAGERAARRRAPRSAPS